MVSRIGVAGVVAVFAAGIWLVAAPFALGYQLAGAGWTGATKTDVITGGLLAVAGFAGLFGVTIGRVVELYADARSDASLASTADRENSCS
ncbi:MAG TPA: hypothetical protein VH021_18935 [Trebonia sp.]|nr:hypothetical protein [Trebonia sp.]